MRDYSTLHLDIH